MTTLADITVVSTTQGELSPGGPVYDIYTDSNGQQWVDYTGSGNLSSLVDVGGGGGSGSPYMPGTGVDQLTSNGTDQGTANGSTQLGMGASITLPHIPSLQELIDQLKAWLQSLIPGINVPAWWLIAAGLFILALAAAERNGRR